MQLRTTTEGNSNVVHKDRKSTMGRISILRETQALRKIENIFHQDNSDLKDDKNYKPTGADSIDDTME
jgi:hypothetical protein